MYVRPGTVPRDAEKCDSNQLKVAQNNCLVSWLITIGTVKVVRFYVSEGDRMLILTSYRSSYIGL